MDNLVRLDIRDNVVYVLKRIKDARVDDPGEIVIATILKAYVPNATAIAEGIKNAGA